MKKDKIMKMYMVIPVFLLMVLLSGCSLTRGQVMDGDGIYYDENTWNFTKIGCIPDVDAEELREVLGDGDVTVEFSVEWTE